ncbi:His Kinase A (phospho-acceptor) domain-containing protein [Poseidonocella pacifica]|uniref:histidine kinase n=1 Tax=Poseidonocella pacifica TaxID=871651 RepID=A0A1I0X6P8_9RHOB|nr:ATP-binding protein [Poseidonocella pacifica]SFA96675.1 His Kinase A (phospho-acceptor) domain-containing protein [Poseidonocella pacifica]
MNPGAYLPRGLAARFVLLLTAALLAANLAALVLLAVQRERLDRQARLTLEVERVAALVPALESLAPDRRASLVAEASRRSARVTLSQRPSLRETALDARSEDLAARLQETLPGRDIRVRVIDRREGFRQARAIAVSIRLNTLAGPRLWLNLRSASPPRETFPGPNEGLLMLGLGLSLLAVLGVGTLFISRLTRPLRELARAARAAGRGDRAVRVPEGGAREMRDAASAFNDMQARIEQFETERMRLLAAVGHDLRTPITSLRLRVEMLDEEEAAPMIRTLEEMTVMANGLIAYAKGTGDAEHPVELALRPLLARLTETLGGRLSPGREVSIKGRPVALGRAFGNLIDNATRYGGDPEVRVRQEDGDAVVTIEDDGPGIPEDRISDMFEPFTRGEPSRNTDTGGAGLGLSIARAIIAGHGGTLTLENRSPRGLIATVRLSAAE